MKLSKLADYSLIIVSMVYSSYVSFLFLSEVSHPIVAGIMAVFVVVLGHHYTFYAVKHFKETKQVSQSILIAITLMVFVFYSEWNGQKVHALSKSKMPTTEWIDKQIETTYKTINENANKKNWRNVEQYRTASEQLEKLQKEKSRILEEINLKTIEAESLANDFRLFSVLLFCVAFIASTLLKDDETKSEKENNLKSDAMSMNITSSEIRLPNTINNDKNIVATQREPLKVEEEIQTSERNENKKYSQHDFQNSVISKIRSGEIVHQSEIMKLLGLNVTQATEILKMYRPKERNKMGFVV